MLILYAFLFRINCKYDIDIGPKNIESICPYIIEQMKNVFDSK